MKKFLLITLVAAFSSTGMNGQETQSKAIKLNPLGALFGNLGLGFEHTLNDKTSVQLNASFFSRGFDVTVTDDDFNEVSAETNYTGFGFAPEYRLYFEEVMKGWYGGFFANYNNITSKTEVDANEDQSLNAKFTISNVGGGIEFGRQWLSGKNQNFVIDLNLGAGYQAASISGGDDNDEDDIEFNLAGSGIWPKLSFAIGYAF